MNKLHGLYLITPNVLDTPLLVTQVTLALKGGARIVQYRNKRADLNLQEVQILALLPICKQYDALLIVNDDPHLAKRTGAQGVHLGQSDISIAHARALLGDTAIIGSTCHDNLELAAAALKSGANYISFGRFFPSQTKPNASSAELSLLPLAKQRFHVPIAAIGGITLESAAVLIEYGVDMLAVCADVFTHVDIEQQARDYVKLWDCYPALS